ncbi:hypothetical protein F8B91_16665 [Aestuariivirga litoralis]|nr:hypothetical protein [Aestuariivirga litoralis]MBG1233972.1 hypothetical protein [Aestuariivirga litoralis]
MATSIPPLNLTPEERKRYERMKRTRQNIRGRVNPATMPDRLTRTSAFAPRKADLITDSNFTRVYEVPGYSVVEVRGRELGSQHRDALVATFRLPRQRISFPNPEYRPGTFILPFIQHYQSVTTWRELLIKMGKTQHVNNLMTLSGVLAEIQQVVILLHEGRSLAQIDADQKKARNRNMLANRDKAGSSSPLLKTISWEGLQLDSKVTIEFGSAVLDAIEKSHLVSINADVQFKLKSDFAKSFWPFIDSQPNFSYIDEERLAQLIGGDIATMDSKRRGEFRKVCRQSFDDMVRAGGLASWRNEVLGSGRNKRHRYHYIHALPRQMELGLLTPAGAPEAP